MGSTVKISICILERFFHHLLPGDNDDQTASLKIFNVATLGAHANCRV